jgi:hypothetical protein
MRWVWECGGPVGWGERQGGWGVVGELVVFGVWGVWGSGYSLAGVGWRVVRVAFERGRRGVPGGGGRER